MTRQNLKDIFQRVAADLEYGINLLEQKDMPNQANLLTELVREFQPMIFEAHSATNFLSQLLVENQNGHTLSTSTAGDISKTDEQMSLFDNGDNAKR